MSDEPPKPAAVSGKSALVGCLLLLVLVAGGCAALVAYGSDSDASRETDAKIWCHQYVKDRLKSPGSADFSGDYVAEGADDGAYTVSGSVDSQNSFGASVRNTFQCTVRKRSGADTWVLVELTGLEN